MTVPTIQHKGDRSWDKLINNTQYAISYRGIVKDTSNHLTPTTGHNMVPHRILRSKKGDTRAPANRFTKSDEAVLAESWTYPLQSKTYEIPKWTSIKMMSDALSTKGTDMSRSTQDPNTSCVYVTEWNEAHRRIDWIKYAYWVDAEKFFVVAETRMPPDPVIS